MYYDYNETKYDDTPYEWNHDVGYYINMTGRSTDYLNSLPAVAKMHPGDLTIVPPLIVYDESVNKYYGLLDFGSNPQTDRGLGACEIPEYAAKQLAFNEYHPKHAITRIIVEHFTLQFTCGNISALANKIGGTIAQDRQAMPPQRDWVLQHSTPAGLAALAKLDLSYYVERRLCELEDLQLTLARNPKVNPENLMRLVQLGKPDVREAVAKHPSTNSDTLEMLSADSSAAVRITAAKHENMYDEDLADLAEDESEEVRVAVAANKSTPVAVLEKLSEDKSPKVKAAVAQNFSAPR